MRAEVIPKQHRPAHGSREVSCIAPQAAFRRTRPARAREGPRRPGDALEVLRPKVLKLEEIAEKSPRAFCNNHHVRLGNSLQTRSEVWRLADDAALTHKYKGRLNAFAQVPAQLP